jgi:predicted MFS family arabinose efflux permease
MSMVPSFFLYILQLTPTMSPWWYYATSASTGLVSWIAVALSALNDVLPQEFRAPGIGLLFAGFLFGISLSPTLALFLHRETLSLVSFAVVCLGFVLTVFVVPETLPAHVGEKAKQRRKERDSLEDEKDRQQVEGLPPGAPERRHCGYGFVSCLWRVYYGSCLLRIVRRVVSRPFKELSILNRNSFFRIITALAFFTGMVTSADQVLLIYYLEDQLNFNAKDVSIMFLIIGATGIFVQVVVMKPLNDLVGEKMVVAISFAIGTIVNLLYGMARHKSTIFVALLIAGFSNMSFPTISAIKANNVESFEQGRIQGALYSVKALASGVGPAVLQYVYSKTKTYHGILLGPGTMFIFASGLFVIGVVLALSLPNDKANTSPRHGGQPASQEGSNSNNEEDLVVMAIDDETLGEYRRLAAESSDDDETYGSI